MVVRCWHRLARLSRFYETAFLVERHISGLSASASVLQSECAASTSRHFHLLSCSSSKTPSASSFDPDIPGSPLADGSGSQRKFLATAYSEQDADSASGWERVPVVTAIATSLKNNYNKRSCSFEVFWGENDPRNNYVIDENSNIYCAQIEAVCLALKQAIYDLNLPRIIVRTDSLYVRNCVKKFLPIWRENDFVTVKGERLKHAEELQELDRLLGLIEAKIELILGAKQLPKRFRTPEKEEPKVENQEFDSEQNSEESESSHLLVESNTRKIAYACGAFRETDVWGNAFARAGFSVYWLNSEGEKFSRRLCMFPVTLFRAQLEAIISALEEAVDREYINVLIRTNSRAFIRHFRNNWRTFGGGWVKNKPQYLRIAELLLKIEHVDFEYEAESSKNMDEALILAEDGMSLPMRSKKKRSHSVPPEKNISRSSSDEDGEILLQKCIHDSEPSLWIGADRVYILSRGSLGEGKKAKIGVFWQKNGEGPVYESSVRDFDGRLWTPTVSGTLLKILNKSVDEGKDRLIVRVKSKRLVRTLSKWIPNWRRRGWLNSAKKPIANVETWQCIDLLMHKIKVKLELITSKEEDTRLRELDLQAERILEEPTVVAVSESNELKAKQHIASEQ